MCTTYHFQLKHKTPIERGLWSQKAQSIALNQINIVLWYIAIIMLFTLLLFLIKSKQLVAEIISCTES